MAKQDNNGLSPEQERALLRLLEGATDEEAAEAAGVARQTVNTWRNHNARFRLEYSARRREMWDGYIDRVRRLIGRSLDALEEDLSAVCDTPEQRRLRQAAALAILRAGLRDANLKPDSLDLW